MSKQRDGLILFFGLLTGVVIIWVTISVVVLINPSFKSFSDLGNFGNMFGVAGSLFSGLSVAALIYTLYLQIRANQEQNFQYNENIKNLAKQSFENSFFILLDFHLQLRSQLIIHKNKFPSFGLHENLKGADIFESLYSEFRSAYNYFHSTKDDKIRINQAFHNFSMHYQTVINHYFRSLYTIIKMINRSSVPDKKFYSNIVRAHLTKYELLILFYNCLSDLGEEKFKPLIQEYSLLKLIDKSLLIKPSHLDSYDQKTFI